MEILLKILMLILSLFLIVLVLLQRGRGGGLAGALGGMGGQSAFGAKAGDTFTRITSGLAIVWILVCVAAVKYMNTIEDPFAADAGAANRPAQESVEAAPGKEDKSSSKSSSKPASSKPAAPRKSSPKKPAE